MPVAAGPWAEEDPEKVEQESSARLRITVRDFMVKFLVFSDMVAQRLEMEKNREWFARGGRLELA